MSEKPIVRRVLAVAVMAVAVVAQADVFNMPTGQASLQFVTVGDPGNVADTTGYGAVPYVYQMGKYDVTVGQYCQFLNAVAKADTYSLYNPKMASPGVKNQSYGCGIVRHGFFAGSYTYSVLPDNSVPGKPDYANYANFPVNYVSWGSAARFCNWLQNGQPTGAEGPGTTETGAYTLNGAVTNAALMAITRNAGATYFIPSENEWYKAAYYKGGGTNAGYWHYPTRSNTTPSNVLSATGTNNVNCATGPTIYLTPVGAFVASPGPYGTYDQGGDVLQWNEAIIGGVFRGLRGGSFGSDSLSPGSSLRYYSYFPTEQNGYLGFRVASVPGVR
jgi:formylglycine-generating enzyme required for sulfatase activity